MYFVTRSVLSCNYEDDNFIYLKAQSGEIPAS